MPYVDFITPLTNLGATLGAARKQNQLESALSALGPNATWQDRANTIMRYDPALGIKTGLDAAKYGLDASQNTQGMSAAAQKAYDIERGRQAAKNEQTSADTAKGADALSSDLADVAGAISELDKSGALVNPGADTWTNVGNYLKATPVGQQIEGMRGTPDQMSRDLVNQIAPSLINHIRQATHQGARSLDSNVELQFYMKQVGDLKAGKIVNFAAMDRLDRSYGSGKLLDTLLADGKITPEEYSRIRSHQFSVPLRGWAPGTAPNQTGTGSGAAPASKATAQEGQTVYDPQGKPYVIKNGQPVPIGQ